MKRLIFLQLLLLLPFTLFAQLSPGDLHKVHKNLEGLENCTKCHSSGKRLSADKCLQCHTLLKERIEKKKGFHATVDAKHCEKCHVEHQGRTAELIYWKDGKDKFDHYKTGFDLEGAHQKLKCEQCHQPKNIKDKERLKKQKKDLKRTFLGLDQKCLSCHVDEHRGQFKGKNCIECHHLTSWKPAAKFDHQKTPFPLTGKHKKVKCEKCHKVVKNKPIGKDKTFLQFKLTKFQKCTDCHTDVHRGKLGKNCQKCHTTQGWARYSKKKFNHDLTSFPLKGRHRNVKCKECHKTKGTFKIARYQQCQDCHVDYHLGQFKDSKSKGKCETCHSEQGFSPSNFTLHDHENTRYPLKGAHKAVPCILCHKKVRFSKGETLQFRFKNLKCQTCHQDEHKGRVKAFLQKKSKLTGFDGCAHCHTVQSWEEVTFDHSLTKFALEGKHQDVDCKKCHKPDAGGVIQFSGLSKQCQGCHDDAHMGQFADRNGKVQCERCHAPKSWLAEKFDHNRDARFKLNGAHQKVACQQCHKKENIRGEMVVRFKPLKTSCKFCHGTEKNG